MADSLPDPTVQLAHDIAHELRGPYCTLQGLLNLVDLEGMTEANMNYIRHQLRRINQVSGHLMEKYANAQSKG